MNLEIVSTPAAPRWSEPAPSQETLFANCKLMVSWACCEEEVRQAQRLRYRVFAEEMGACLTPPAGSAPGLDIDRFDAFCDHLLVKIALNDGDEDGPLVGTYRVLPPDAARRAGGLYLDTEFDLAPLASLRRAAVELGRSCVHSDWRSGGVILALWSALCRYMFLHRLETMMGCASVSLNDGGQSAVRLWRGLCTTHLIERQWQVQPHTALPLGMDGDPLAASALAIRNARTPPLIKGYLRCGARLLGPPALDVAFNTADLPMMLRIDDLAPRYRKHFLAGN